MWTKLPNYTTGTNATPELYAKLVDFARRKDIRVIVNDNPYSFILKRPPSASSWGAKSVAIKFNSMSKSHEAALSVCCTRQRRLCAESEHRARYCHGSATGGQRLGSRTGDDGNNKNYRNRRHIAGEIMHALGITPYNEKQVGTVTYQISR